MSLPRAIPASHPRTRRHRHGGRASVPALLALALAPLWPAIAAAAVVNIQAAKDNTLYQLASGTASNGVGEYLFTGQTKEGFNRRAVIQFNVAAAIPSGSTINSVTLQMRVSRTKNNTLRATTLHRLQANWGEGTSNAAQSEGQGAPATANDATWIHRFFPDSLWTTPGGSFDATATATVLVSGNGIYMWTGGTLALDVQGWLDNPANNFGWLIRGDESAIETAKRFDGKDNTNAGNRPVLIVDYTPGAGATGACCTGSTCAELTAAQCAAISGTYRGDGTTCTPNPCGVVADSLVAGASADNTLYQDATGSLSNGAGALIPLSTHNQSGLIRRGVVRFDLSSIPTGATVQSATLRLYNTTGGTNATDVTVHRATAGWGEGTSVASGNQDTGAPATTNDATWLHRFYPSTNWTTAGGDYLSTASATTNMGGEGLYLWSSASLTADVQGWVTNPAANFGWVVRGREQGGGNAGKRVASRQNATAAWRPALLVHYTVPPPPPTGACCLPGGSCDTLTMAACSAAAGTYRGDGTTCSPNPCPLVLTPYVDSLPRPAVAVPVSGTPGGAADYVIPIVEFTQRLHRDLPPTRLWGYAGTYPGPTIEATSGVPINVTWWNDLRDSLGALRTTHLLPVDMCLHGPDSAGATARVVTHLHGGHVPAASDGHPDSTLLPGQQVLYPYPNNQAPGTLWYHDHALGITRLNVMLGLAGFYLIRDAFENALGLPAGEYEIPLAIQDRSFRHDGSLVYPEMWMEHFEGDVMLVNGKVWPYLRVKQGKYRFRMVNGCNSRFLRLSLSNGAPFTVIGSELGLLPAPVQRDTLLISNGERYDVVIDFSAYPPGTQVVLANDAPTLFPGTPGEGVIPNVMRFEVIAATGHTAPIPASLRAVSPIDTDEAAISRDFVLRKTSDPCTGGIWTINDMHWDHVSEYPLLGDTEIWRFINDSGISHPMHMHLVQFQVVDRQPFTRVAGEIVPTGPPVPPSPEESGWKDTAPVGPNEILRVIARFEDYAGHFAYHCHILEHEDHEMMRQFRSVEPPVASVRDTIVSEGGGTAAFAVTLSIPAPIEVRVIATTDDGSATAGADYTAVTDTVVFAPGETAGLFPVPVLQDGLDEPDETFTVRLAGFVNAVGGDTLATGTILDDDVPAPPAVSVSDTTVSEADGVASFRLTLSAASAQEVRVIAATEDGTALAGADYTAVTDTVVFAPGETTGMFPVPVLQEGLAEYTETFSVRLVEIVQGVAGDTVATGVILDDDPDPVVSIGDAAVGEGDADSTLAAFTVTRSARSAKPMRVLYTTVAGSATAGVDFRAIAAPETLHFAPEDTTLTKDIPVVVYGDTDVEPDETFFVHLASPFAATLSDSVGDGTITNDDGPVGVPAGNPALSYLGRGTPNPFAERVALSWGMSERGRAELAIFDVQGRRIRRLVHGVEEAGHKTTVWDGRDGSGNAVAPGVYLVRLHAGSRVFRGTVLRLR